MGNIVSVHTLLLHARTQVRLISRLGRCCCCAQVDLWCQSPPYSFPWSKPARQTMLVNVLASGIQHALSERV